jgi:Adenylate and Guanylate cyclase catalytic domain
VASQRHHRRPRRQRLTESLGNGCAAARGLAITVSTRGAQRKAATPARVSDAGARIRRDLDRGAPWDACDVFRAAEAQARGDAELLYWGALAHARAGASAVAHALLDRAGQASPSTHLVPEILSLRGRLWKDAVHGRAKLDARGRAAASRAREQYRAAYAHSARPYPGVNAATMSLLLGDRAEARSLARAVLARLAPRKRLSPWDHATRAEAQLLLGHVSRARASYAAAYATAHGDAGVIATMRRQLTLLASVSDDASELLATIPATDVLAFVGHMIDAPDARDSRFPAELEDVVAAAVRGRIANACRPIAYTSAACGSDLVFIEEALALGAEVNIVLPFAREDFARTSVAVAGPSWLARFERALRGANRVIMATEEAHLGDDVLYEYAARMLEGLALLRAAHVYARPRLLAVVDTTSGARVGGTRASLERWRRNGGSLDVIDLRALREAAGRNDGAQNVVPADAASNATRTGARPGASRRSSRASAPTLAAVASTGADSSSAAPRAERALKTLLFADFAGYSRLHDGFAPLFQRRFLAIGARQIAAAKAKPLEVKTWGDALYGVFESPRDGADFALGLLRRMLRVDWTATGLPATSQIRIALHAGPVFSAFDPIMARDSYFGSNVTRAARIEPITPPGMVYASEAFAGLLMAEGRCPYRLEYVGMLPLAKGYGASRIYRVDRR